MKILKLLNKINLSILISFFFLQNSYSTEPIDIWNIENQTIEKDTIINSDAAENEISSIGSIYQNQNGKKNNNQVNEEKNLLSKNIVIVGIYDPSDNDLSIDMWKNSNGTKIIEIFEKIQNINLSEDAIEILNLTLLTNSYFPERNMNKEQFLKMKSDWLIKNQDFKLMEAYLEKNNNLENGSPLVKYYIDYYLSRADLGRACEIFNKINFLINDNYVLKFNIYCLLYFRFSFIP